MKETTEDEAVARLSALCAQAEHCTFDMTEKMRRWRMTDAQIARVMEFLTTHKFVDDRRYARALALDKIRFNKWGRRKVEQALWAKHISEEIRDEALNAIDSEEYLRVLRPLMESKRRTIKAASDFDRNAKLIRFAVGRGFTYDIIRQCVDGGYDEE